MGETVPIQGKPSTPQNLSINEKFSVVGGRIIANQLNNPRLRQYPKMVDPNLKPTDPNQTFDDCRTIEGWTDLIHKLLKAAWGTESSQINWTFTHDFNLLANDPTDLKGIYIVYDLITEMPAQMASVKELKPRIREVKTDSPNGGNYVWGQQFDVMVAFTVYADSWNNAIIYTEKLKEFMITYSGIFKQLGLQEFYYHGQMRDALYDPPHAQESPTRTLFYKVKIERQYNIEFAKIEEVLIAAGIINGPDQDNPELPVEAILVGSDTSSELPSSQ